MHSRRRIHIYSRSVWVKKASLQQRSARPQAPNEEDDDDWESEKGELETEGQPVPSQHPKMTSQTPRKKNSRHRYFGIGKSMPAQQPQVFNSDDYEQKYPDDKRGEELGPNARFYRVYLDEHLQYRFEQVEGWKDNLDVLLVFAGLFSAVVTTIVVEASQSLQPDYAELTTALLIHQSAILSQMLSLQRGVPLDDTSPPPDIDTTFVASTNARWVNGLWFTSLALSLATALIAVVAKQWLQSYMSSPTGTPQQRARLLHMRQLSLERWKVPTIIGLLPFLLHISLLLFFCGLVIHLLPINRGIGVAVGSIALACYLAYFVTTVLPLVGPTCAYKTPLSFLIYIPIRTILSLLSRFVYDQSEDRGWNRNYRYRHKWRRKVNDWLSPRVDFLKSLPGTLGARETSLLNNADYALNIDWEMFKWMYSFSFNPSATSITLQVACCPGFLQQKTLPGEIADALTEEVRRCVGDNANTRLKGERPVRALLSHDIELGPLALWEITRSAYRGMLLLSSTWLDLLPKLGIAFYADLSLLAFDPNRFGRYWDDITNPYDGYCTISSLLSPSSIQCDDNVDQQKCFGIICTKLRGSDDLESIRPILTRLFGRSGDQPPTTLTHTHVRVLAFLGLLRCTIVFNPSRSAYPVSDRLDTLEEMVHAFGEIVLSKGDGPPADGCGRVDYVALLDCFMSITLSKYLDLQEEDRARLVGIQEYAREQVNSCKAQKEVEANENKADNGQFNSVPTMDEAYTEHPQGLADVMPSPSD